VRTYRFYQVDVFTDVPFGGNQLAVFPDAAGLSADEMQKIAREMNLSETTFVFPPRRSKADFWVRIFTPGSEVPFAGHPVVGTHFVLAQLGRIPLVEPVTTASLELAVGVLPADLHVADGQVTSVVMSQDEPVFGQIWEGVDVVAGALGIAEQEIESTGLPVQVVSTGLPHLIVPVRSLAAVQQIAVNEGLLRQVLGELDICCVMPFSFETEREENTVHTRMFAPELGVVEDPATGSGSGCLGAYLVQHDAVPVTEPTTHIVTEQGAEINRPSRIFIEVDSDGGEVLAVRVGGEVVSVLEGVLSL